MGKHDAQVQGRDDGLLSVGEVARASGAAASAVRFYERHGVIHAFRTASNQRRFAPATPCRIQVARLAQAIGLTVREIAALFEDLPAEPGRDDWARVGDRLVAEAEARVARLRTNLELLGTDAKLCELGSALPARTAGRPAQDADVQAADAVSSAKIRAIAAAGWPPE